MTVLCKSLNQRSLGERKEYTQDKSLTNTHQSLTQSHLGAVSSHSNVHVYGLWEENGDQGRTWKTQKDPASNPGSI